MAAVVLHKDACLASLPPEWPEDLLPGIQARVSTADQKVVILDDDPTGTQTVHGMPVLTTWSVPTLRQALREPGPGFFVLTNSRSLEREAACVRSMEIGMNLQTAAELAGTPIDVISRSDSTLRGHFPHEVDAVAKAMGIESRPYLIMPFFPEGGRLTINDVHYVAEEENLVPAAMTAYAQDAAFGFKHSDLKQWIAEKTGGRIPAEAVSTISLDDIRKDGPERVGDLLGGVRDNTACIVNAVTYRDVEVLVVGLAMAAEAGRRFLFRTAAAFVRVMTGIELRADFLAREELVTDSPAGGLFVVGSYVPKTTAQVQALLEQTDIEPVEVGVARLLADPGPDAEIEQAAKRVNSLLASGRDVVLYTSRELVTGADAKASLDIGQIVSHSLIQIVQALEHQPRYLVAKGGITSSDVATQGLGVRRALISGQVLPGVPVWQLENDSRYPGMSYVVFPGNVGEDDALVTIQNRLARG